MGMKSQIESKLAVIEDNILKDLWWYLVPGQIVTVPWPNGWTESDHLGPNDHWRPWLESKVGRQGWDWDWNISKDCQHLDIKFRRAKRDAMVQFKLRWL